MSQPNEQNRIPGVDFVVSEEAIQRADINALLSDLTSVDCHDINEALRRRVDGESPDVASPLDLMITLTSYHSDPDHPTEPFKPRFQFEDRRGLIPSDMLEEQVDVLANVASGIRNAGLRGRIADVVWFVQRRRTVSAELAVNSYCDCIDQVRTGQATFAFEDHSAWGWHAKELAVRSARISLATQWRMGASARLKTLVADLVSEAYENAHHDDFVRMVGVDIAYGFTSPADLAVRAENLATQQEVADSTETRRSLWKSAARCHRANRDEDNHNRCMIEVAKCVEERANQAGSAMVAATFLQEAVQILRNLPKGMTREYRERLMSRSQEVRPKISDEMGVFSTEVDLTDVVQQAVDSVRGRSWPNVFLCLILSNLPPEPDELRQEARQHAGEFPLQGLMPIAIHDHQGRVVFRSPGMAGANEADGEHLRYLMASDRGHARQVAVAGRIIPIRRVIAEEHLIAPDIVVEMLAGSPFIPPGHDHIFARAIVHFLAGADMEAASLLVPQLENSLRHLLSLKGIDTTTSDEHGIQTEASLSALLNPKNPWRAELEAILLPRHVLEIDLLYNFAGGPALRNALAHGKIPAGAFWGHNVIYSNWFIIRLAALPLAKNWGDVEETFARVTGLRPPLSAQRGDST